MECDGSTAVHPLFSVMNSKVGQEEGNLMEKPQVSRKERLWCDIDSIVTPLNRTKRD
jgi:hypothetical protein